VKTSTKPQVEMHLCPFDSFRQGSSYYYDLRPMSNVGTCSQRCKKVLVDQNVTPGRYRLAPAADNSYFTLSRVHRSEDSADIIHIVNVMRQLPL